MTPNDGYQKSILPFIPKRVVKDFLIKFTKKPQKKCQEADFSS